MWFFQLLIFQRGMETIRKFIDFCGPAVYVVMFILMGWILSQAGFAALDLTLGDKVLSGRESFVAMGNATLLVVSYFAALLLNFGDFSRFAKSERQMKVGNFLGLPVNFVLFSIVVVIVTAGSAEVFGTMKGGLIASILAVVVCPWIFVDSPKAITCTVTRHRSNSFPRSSERRRSKRATCPWSRSTNTARGRACGASCTNSSGATSRSPSSGCPWPWNATRM